MHGHRRTAAAFFVSILVLAGLSANTLASATRDVDPHTKLASAWDKLRGAGFYNFTADVQQTLIPRAVSRNIGKGDQRADMRIEGEVRSNEDMTLRVTLAGGPQAEPVVFERRGDQTTVTRSDGTRALTDDPLGLVPSADMSVYLAGATNVRVAEESESGAAKYSFDISGERIAAYLRSKGNLVQARPGVFQNATGRGELWVRSDGLPVRQVISLRLPNAGPDWDADTKMTMTFGGLPAAGRGPAPDPIRAMANWARQNGPTGLMVVFTTLALALAVVLYRRNPRRAQRLIAVAVAVWLGLQSPAQALASGVSASRPKVDLAEALGLPSEAPVKPAAAAGARGSAAPFSPLAPSDVDKKILECGDGEDTDKDGDGLKDYQEGCLGTSAHDPDTDGDGVNDYNEVTLFTLGAQQWAGDPLKLDSNGDGLADDSEYPTSRGGIAPVGVLSDTVQDGDYDQDGIPNLWDDDNDGDGVPDGIDLSPFAKTAYTDSFALNVQNATTNTHTYIEFQLQPEDPAHLRYTTTPLDWPTGDGDGTIKDLDDTDADLRLVPVLKVRVNVTPTRALSDRYGFSSSTDDDGSPILLIPMMVHGDGGAVRAFYGKVAYQPGVGNIQWQGATLLWMVQAEVDTYSAAGLVTTSNDIVQVYSERARLAGLNIVKSRDFESVVFRTPNHNDNDRYMFQIMAAINQTFMEYERFAEQAPAGTAIEDIARRFGNPNTPVEERFGVPLTVSTVASTVVALHLDQGIALTGERIQGILDTIPGSPMCAGNGQSYRCASIGVATEADIGAVDLSLLTNGSTADLTNAPMMTKRSLKMAMYEEVNGLWQPLDTGRVLTEIERRYADSLQDVIADFMSRGQVFTEDQMRLALYMSYLAWTAGTLTTIALDAGTLVKPEAPTSLKIAAASLGAGGSSSNVLSYIMEFSEIAELTTNGGTKTQKRAATGYAIGKIVVFAANLALTFAQIACAANDKLAGCGKDNEQKFKTAQTVIGSFNVAVQVGDTIKVLATASKAGTFKDGIKLSAFKAASSTASKGMTIAGAVIGLVIGLTITWVTFGLTASTFKDNPIVLNNAIALAVVTTVYLVFLFILTFIPFGQIISAIFAVIDAILAVATGGDWSVSRVLTELFYSAKAMTEIVGSGFVGATSDTIVAAGNPSGVVVGNTYQQRDTFTATLKAVNNGVAQYGLDDDGSQEDLDDSYAYAEYEIVAITGTVNASLANGQSVCSSRTISDAPAKDCTNQLGLDVGFTSPAVNAQVNLVAVSRYSYVWADCGLWAVCAIKHVEAVQSPTDSEKPTATVKLYFDVLPNTLTGLWTWSAIGNPDRDGDGVANGDETALGLNPDNWDTDGDGLSDGYERDNASTRGLNATKADTDGDGLSDGQEVRLGLMANDADSDNDGIPDGEEIFRPVTVLATAAALDAQPAMGESATATNAWAGGWVITLPGGLPVRVFGNPGFTNFDGDNLLDGQERDALISPFAVHTAPRLRIEGEPYGFDPNGGKSGVYVAPGTRVTTVVSLGSFGSAGITGTLRDCVPSLLTSQTGGTPVGDRTPPMSVGACAGGTQYSYNFASPNVLQVGERMSVTHRAVANPGAVASAVAKSTSSVPWLTRTITASLDIGIDVDNPTITLYAPGDGAVLRGSAYVMGGAAADATSWVSSISLVQSDGVSDVPLATLQAISHTMSPFAFTWMLPDDGVYTLTATAMDHVGRAAADSNVNVIVDNALPLAALDLPSPFVRPETTGTITITLQGNSSDNLSGIERVQISIDGAPWRETFIATGPYPLAQAWSYPWIIAGSAAQGSHSVRVRAYDRAGNLSNPSQHTVIVDMLAPTSELTTDHYKTTPDVKVGEVVTLTGVANDAGRAPLSFRPQPLFGSVNAVLSATVWLQPEYIEDDDAGAFAHWLGDVNGDGRADLAIGLPAAADGRGKVIVIYGKAGGFAQNSLLGSAGLMALGDSRAQYIGAAGAGIGGRIAAIGDVNGDGLYDMLVGDPVNGRAFVIFGSPNSPGPMTALEGPQSGRRIEITAPGQAGFGGAVAAAGDVNGDGFDDFIVGGSTRAFVLMGHAQPWLSSYDANAEHALRFARSATWPAQGVGDLNNDERDDLAIGVAGGVGVITGSIGIVRGANALVTPTLAVASADPAPRLAALGDVDGDGLSDFALSDGATPKAVFGGAPPYTVRSISLAPAASGFLAAPGDVNADGLNDLLIGNAAGDAYLIHGAAALKTPGTFAVASTLSGVSGAASAPYAAGADLNCDLSSDIVAIPSNANAVQNLQPGLARAPSIPLGDIQNAGLPVGSPAALPAGALVVDDDGGAGHTSIQAAIDAASAGDTILVRAGVYGPFTITKNNLSVVGVDPDQVFVDAGGGAFGAKVVGVTGARISAMTVRNAQDGIVLDDAGVGGYITQSLRTRIERVLVHAFSSNGMETDRTSTLVISQTTFAGAAGAGSYLRASGPADASLIGAWATKTSMPGGAGVSGGGGIFSTSDNRVFALRGNATTDLYEYNVGPDSWTAKTAAPLAVSAGMPSAMTSGNDLYTLAPPDWETNTSGTPPSNIRKAVRNNAGNILALGSGTTLYHFNGTSWTQMIFDVDYSGGHDNPAIHDIIAVNDAFYIGGLFDEIQFNSAMPVWTGASYTSETTFYPTNDTVVEFRPTLGWRATGFNIGNVGWRIASDGTYFCGTAFDGQINCNLYNPYGVGSQVNLAVVYSGGCPDSCFFNDDDVKAMSVVDGKLYIGGEFEDVDESLVGGFNTKPVGGLFGMTLASPLANSTFISMGASSNGDVYAIGGLGLNVYVGGTFSTFRGISASRIARWNGSSFSALGSGISAGSVVSGVAVIGDNVYVGGDFSQVAGGTPAANVARWNETGSFWAAVDGGANGPVFSVFGDQGRNEVVIGGRFTSVDGPGETAPGVALLRQNRFRIYDVGSNSWATVPPLSMPRVTEDNNSAMAADGSGNVYVAYYNNGLQLWRYDTGIAQWTELTPVLAGSSQASTMLFHSGYLWLLRGDGLYRRLPSVGSAWQTMATPPNVPVAFNAGLGAGLVWDGGDFLYATQGGGGNRFARYSLGGNAWSEIAELVPGTVGSGGGMVRVGGTLYALRGNGFQNLYSYGPVNVPPVTKLWMNNVAFVAPIGAAAAQWIEPFVNEQDWGYDLANISTVGSAVWTPGVPPISFANARLVDQPNGVFRTEAGTTLLAGYYTPKPEATVSPLFCSACANDGLVFGQTAFADIQTAINSGAPRVRVRPGIYRETVNLAAGVSVIGSGAELTLIEPVSPSLRGSVQVEGAPSTTLARVSLVGAGYRAEQGAKNAKLTRAIVRGAATGIAVDGSATDLEVVNNTVVKNGTGFAATACADMDVRNSIFASNTVVGVSYQTCAASELERYNLYYENGPDGFADVSINGGAPVASSGAGVVQKDPLFANAFANDYRLQPDSPARKAGNPADPTPLGLAGRVDLGYLEQANATYYVSKAYCAQCVNDGLAWQVDAFTSVQGALDSAADELQGLAFADLEQLNQAGLRFVVAVGAGAFTETLSVPSYVALVGLGPDKTTLRAVGGAAAVTLQDVVNAGVANVSLVGNTTGPGVMLLGNVNGFFVERNVIRLFNAGVDVAGNGSGVAEFNTFVLNFAGLRTNAAGAWIAARNNIFATNSFGMQRVLGAMYSDFNLLFGSTVQHYDGVTPGPGDQVGQNPLFVNAGVNNFRLQANSPAVDAASPDIFRPTAARAGFSSVPVGGGDRADLGAFETLAAPIVLLFGKEGVSCAVGNSGVQTVEVSLIGPVAPASTYTGTLPGAWDPASLQTPLTTATYWRGAVLPASEGVFRIYSRAADRLNNMEDAPGDLYEGAMRADGTPPAVSLTSPAAPLASSIAAVALVGQVAAFGGPGTAQDVYFEAVSGGVTTTVTAQWSSDTWTPGQPRSFFAFAALPPGAHDVRAAARDLAGNTGASAPVLVTISASAAHRATIAAPITGTWVKTTSLPVDGFVRFANNTGPQTVRLASGPNAVTVTVPGATANVPTAFAGALTLPGAGSHVVTARALNGSAASTIDDSVVVNVDLTAPSVAAGLTTFIVTGTAVVTGTASDGQSGLASVEVSFDGGYIWLPATAAGGSWVITAALPGLTERTDYPMRARATDVAGNASETAFGLVLDNIAPRGLEPVQFNIPEGTHVDSIQTLVMTWTPPIDSLGIGRVGVAIDQAPATVPGNSVVVTSHSASMSADGSWYAHLVAVDLAGNANVKQYGPWFVATGLLCVAPQTIVLDGVIDTPSNEWRAAERLDDDEATIGVQELFATWDAANVYLGWRGASLPTAGVMWLYLDTQAGGSTTGVGGEALPMQADAAVQVTSAGSAVLWTWNGSAWANGGAPAFAHANGHTEVRVPATVTAVTNLGLVAFVKNGPTIVSAFPTTNRAGLPQLTSAYAWANPCSITNPNAGQPTADAVNVTLGSVQPANVPLGPNVVISYVLTVKNLEQQAVAGGNALWAATAELALSTGNVALGSLAAGSTHVFSVSGALAASLMGVDRVTTTVTTTFGVAQLSHVVDGVAPTTTIDSLPGGVIGIGAQTLLGTASDPDSAGSQAGSGVAKVQVSVNEAAYADAAGVLPWSLPVSVTGELLTVTARSVDYAGNVGEPVTQVLIVDSVPPTVSFALPSVISPTNSVIFGTSSDEQGLPLMARLAPNGPGAIDAFAGNVDEVEVQINDENGLWLLVTFMYSPTQSGRTWSFSWPLPFSDSVEARMRARARDLAGNLSEPTEWQTTTIDSVLPNLFVQVALTETTPNAGMPALMGVVSDGAGIGQMFVLLYGPNSTVMTQPIVFSPTPTETAWYWLPAPNMPTGKYAVRVIVVDRSGNVSVAGPFELTVAPGSPTSIEVLALSAVPIGRDKCGGGAVECVRIRWETAAEAGTLGYRLHRGRADAATGAVFEDALSVTPELILASGGEGGSYAWVDETLTEPGEYAYWLVIERTGGTTVFGPARAWVSPALVEPGELAVP